MGETYINGKVLTQRHFRDERYDRTITELELYNEYVRLRDNNETDAETFDDYVRNCTGKNGTLTEIPYKSDVSILQAKTVQELIDEAYWQGRRDVLDELLNYLQGLCNERRD